MQTSTRMQAVQQPIIALVGDLIRNHPGTISLGQGVVHYGPPPAALARLESFLSDPANHKYKPVDGLPELVACLEAKLRAENGIEIGASSRVIVTAGGNMAFYNALLAIADPGDEIVLLAPYYFNHEMAVAMANCRAVVASLDANYQIDLDTIAAAMTPRTRAVVTISPNNPSGAVYSREALTAVNQLCRERGVYHISDEAYEYFVYGNGQHFSPGSLPGAAEHTISLYSLSKAYGMASWRIGYMVIPPPLVSAVRKAQDTILICAPAVSQAVAVGALSAGSSYCHARIERLGQVRAHVLDELSSLDRFCTIPAAWGAFYFLLRLDTELDSVELAERLIREHGVAVIPGATFGIERGCYLRVAYGALDSDTVAEGIGRLTRGLTQIIARRGA